MSSKPKSPRHDRRTAYKELTILTVIFLHTRELILHKWSLHPPNQTSRPTTAQYFGTQEASSSHQTIKEPSYKGAFRLPQKGLIMIKTHWPGSCLIDQGQRILHWSIYLINLTVFCTYSENIVQFSNNKYYVMNIDYLISFPQVNSLLYSTLVQLNFFFNF